jgi:hypothetical protein
MGPAVLLRMRSAAVLVLLSLASTSLAQQRPLPDAKVFLAQVKERLQSDEQRQSGYMYVETRRELKLDKTGRSTKETIKVFESYPGLPGEPRWRRLVSENGKPIPSSELAKHDRERQKRAEAHVRKLAKQTDKDRQKEAREREKRRRENAEEVEDVFRVYDVKMIGREALEGHDSVVFSLTPRRGVKPRTRDGGIMLRFAGKAWVSESDYELVRLEMEAIDNVSFGLGLLARVHKGSRAAFQRRKVNGEVWLPASVSYTASARVLLFKSMRVGGTSDFSAYRKFTVGTDTTFSVP